jgi:2-isopropylmalate synthase
MLTQPNTKYRAFPPIDLPNRTWVSKTITHPPIWLSTDLRDGNQALIEPMNGQQKLRLFQLLIDIGFQEIEVGFPSASQTDFDFVRSLVTDNLIPDHVTIQVLTPARGELIRRTFEALRGVKRAIVHLYNATCPEFRRIVFGLDQAGTIALATSSTQLIKQLAAEQPETDWRFEYSPETFTATELDFAKTICDAVLDVWQPMGDRKAIINLPATVEVATPNVFADQVEWMHRHLARRDAVVLSVHPHNDRGSGVAAAELAQMAGADRVEGCLFGNGERTGNVDLVTLALNLYTQGVHPGLDFSNINAVARVVEDCTQLSIHPRHPYVGDLVFTAFSGSHQDAIRKGLAAQQAGIWEVPYLPIDPTDLGRTYESVIRVNSQSGKGGIAFLLERDYHLILPRRLQIDFSRVVQEAMDQHGQEMESASLWRLFEQEYVRSAPFEYLSHRLLEVERNVQTIATMIQVNGQPTMMNGQGNGPIDAFLNALNLGVQVHHYEEHSLTQGSDARAIAYVEIGGENWERPLAGLSKITVYGVGMHHNLITASLLAIVSGVNRAVQQGVLPFKQVEVGS